MHHILLTGATGLIGGKLLRNLPHGKVTCLVRNPGNLESAIRGDIAKSGLGLNDECYRALSHSVTEIIHCAADIRFGQTLEQSRETNAEGASRMLAFARKCPRLRKFAHVSTVYVAGKTPGPLPEALSSNSHGFFNVYEQTKHEAEQRVAAEWADLPAAIFRLSTVIGSSVTGRVEQFNYFHQLLKWAPQNPLPMIPGCAEARADLIPTEWAIASLAALYETAFEAGRVLNICAGPADSLSIDEILHLTFDLVGSRARMPKIVSLEQFEAFAARRSTAAEARIRELLTVVSGFLPHLAIPQFFENGQTQALLIERGIHLPPIRDYYAKIVRYCVETNWGRSANGV